MRGKNALIVSERVVVVVVRHPARFEGLGRIVKALRETIFKMSSEELFPDRQPSRAASLHVE